MVDRFKSAVDPGEDLCSRPDCGRAFGKKSFPCLEAEAPSISCRLALRKGLELIVQNFKPRQDFSFQIKREQSPVHFGYLLQGEFCADIRQGGARVSNFPVSAGSGGVLFLPNTVSTGHYAAQSRFTAVSLDVSPGMFQELADDAAPALPVHLRGIAQGKLPEKGFVLKSKITARLTAVLHDIVNIQMDAPCAKLYAEAKVLELLSLQIGQFTEAPQRFYRFFRLDQAARSRLSQVRDRLAQDLQNPPSLIELSREAGMSHVKLNRCFKQIYGLTAFECLRQARLDKARELLLSDNCSIAEAALSSGFSDQSHLNRCFKRHFGVTPGHYRRAKQSL